VFALAPGDNNANLAQRFDSPAFPKLLKSSTLAERKGI
jgi:hypothetical protein